MGFLAPAWLGLAALAAVPLLLHVLRQRAGTRIDFPAVRWLAAAEQDASRRLRLRQLLLLALRALAIVAIALAAARPTFDTAGPPRTLVVVLDDSPSTAATVDGRPVRDALVAAARRAWGLGAEQRLLLTTDGRVHRTQGAVDSVLAAARPASGGDLTAAVRRAVALARAAGRGAAVAVVTDGQATAWRDSIGARGVRVAVLVPPGTPAANAAVVALRARPARWNPRGDLEATLRFARDSLAWTASIDTTVLARGTARRPAAESLAVVRIPLVAPDTGWTTATLAITPEADDALEGDDRATTALHVAPPAAVRADAGPWVAAALEALAEAGRVRPAGSGRVVTIGAPTATTALPAVLLLPDAPGALAGANAALARLGIPYRFGDLQATDAAVVGRDETFRGDTAVRALRVAPLVAVAPAVGGDTLATVGRQPLVVAGEGWVLVGAALDPAALTLPLRAAFVPWLLDAIDRAAGGGAPPRPVAAGGPAVDESALARAPLPTIAARLGGDATHVVTADGDAWRDALAGDGNPRPVVLPFLALALLCLVAESRLARGGAGAARLPTPVPA